MNTMPKACGVPEHQSTQDPRATGATGMRILEFDPEFFERTERVRTLLRTNLPLGARQQIAADLEIRKESVSRQLAPSDAPGAERLSEDLAILGQLWLELTDGMQGIADEVRTLRYAGTNTILVQIPSGTDTWTFTFKRSTGEVKP